MAYKQSKHLFQGMSKDLSDDKQKGIYYIDAHNIRITAREDTTLLSVTNEKGNSALNVISEDDNQFILGQYVGHAVLNNYLVLFTVRNDISNIWRLDLTKPDEVKSKLLYSGNLGFSADNPIETLVDYETEDVQKVYWTDGDNQPRVVNIVSDNIKPNADTQFDFVPEVFPNGHDSLNIKVEKLINSTGTFKSGTIQYFISYYNKFGQESNIVWQSPLLYISPADRGGNVSETVGNAFQLDIIGAATTFDFIRIYSVQHTSEDTDLIGRRIIDLSIPSTPSETITFIDNGILGESLNPSELYYKGGVPTTIGTMAAKDQTLFLGNINLDNNQKISDEVKTLLKNSFELTFRLASAFPVEEAEGKYYTYYNQLNENGQIQHPDRPITHSIKSFKYLEKYRFGLQFQDKYGRWSEPVWVGDFTNNVAPSTTPAFVQLPIAEGILDRTLLDSLGDYVKVRPVVVLPHENERECIAQGVLCPTVYNVQDRLDNSPFAQPSWFFRPYWPISWPYKWNQYADEGKGADYGTLLPYAHNGLILGGLSLKSEIEKSYSTQGYYTEGNKIRISKKGYEGYTEHNYFPNYDTYYNGNKEKDLTRINNPRDFYYIDQSLVTLNSPDIEFQDTLPTENIHFRVIGALNITGCYGTMYLETENSPNTFWEGHEDSNGLHLSDTNIVAKGFYKKDIAIANYNSGSEGWRVLANGPYWLDVPYYYWKKTSSAQDVFSDWAKPADTASEFILYPWQSGGSIGGGSFNISEMIAPQNGDLKRKIISNIRYSPETLYLTQPLNYETSDVQFTTETNTTVTANVSNYLHYSNSKIVYYSDIDKLLSVPVRTYSDNTATNNENYGFDITVANREFSPSDSPTNAITAYTLLRKQRAYNSGSTAPEGNSKTQLHKKYTATSITYKSTSHAIIALSPSSDDTLNILPSVNGYGTIPEYRSSSSVPEESNVTGDHNLYPKYNTSTGVKYKCVSKSFWQTADTPTQYVDQKNITLQFQHDGGILLLGELYRDYIPNKFGGTTEDALQQNVWIPAGESVNISDLSSTDPIRWTEGDTYFQRYDCLKTYPYSNESMNNIVEILSFMCETRVNIAGRYDKNRGLIDNTFITNENFNLINKGYTQKNNFFSYMILDSRFGLEQFKTQLTWTKVKSAGALVDNWTNITLTNTLDLDGDKGDLVSLNRYKNDIIAFQPKGISQIIYNPNVQINTEAGLPIEIANSGKVQGKRYLYEGIGCQNKWSICDEVYGSLYFIDNLAKGIYKLSDQGLVSLTDTKGFRAWMEGINTLDSWKPYFCDESGRIMSDNFKTFRTFYDKTYKDIYFVNGETCLVYSDLLDQFISFMDYQGTNGMVNIGDSFYAISPLFNGSIWKQFAGEYNSIYNEYKNYSITFIDNAIPEMNKIYTNLEYRSDTYIDEQLKSDQTFDTIRVYNEYQDTGEHLINTVLDKPYLSDLQKKFRVWRIQLPRDRVNPLNRINNTWTKITLGKTKVKNEKTVLHDAVVGYYI